jgi:ketol-acid reductoisomerase
MDYMYNACSTTARRGALDWAPIFEKANLPIFEQLYESVKNGTETRKSLEFNGRSTYRQDLAKELKAIDDQESWRAGMCFLFALALCVLMTQLPASANRKNCPSTPSGCQV